MKLRLDHPAWRRLAPALARGLLRLFLGTTRMVLHGDPEGKALYQSEAAVIFAVWHCHLLAPLYSAGVFCQKKPPIVLMASPSRDGEFIAQVAQGLGFLAVPGSRRKGGVQALQQMAAYIRQGHSAGLAADGSRGPAHEVQKGVLYLARETGAPILPVAAAASRKLTLNTWDRFEIPLPLGRSAILVGAPVRVTPRERGAALEQRRQALQARMHRLFQLSQQFFAQP